MSKYLIIVFMFSCVSCLFACGGGGGGGGGASGGATQTVAATTKPASFRLRTTGVYGGKIYGISMTVGIPAGFVMNTDSGGTTAAGVVAASGPALVNSSTSGKLTGASLEVGIINAFGFNSGEFITVSGEIPIASAAPLPAAFVPVTLIKVSDGFGASIPGVGVEVF